MGMYIIRRYNVGVNKRKATKILYCQNSLKSQSVILKTKLIHITHIYGSPLSWFGTGNAIKSCEVTLVILWPKTHHPMIDTMPSCKRPKRWKDRVKYMCRNKLKLWLWEERINYLILTGKGNHAMQYGICQIHPSARVFLFAIVVEETRHIFINYSVFPTNVSRIW